MTMHIEFTLLPMCIRQALTTENPEVLTKKKPGISKSRNDKSRKSFGTQSFRFASSCFTYSMDGWTLKLDVIYESRIQLSIVLSFPSHYRYHPRDLSLLEEIVTDCFYIAGNACMERRLP